MKHYFFSRIIGMVFLAAVSISCTSNLDFNQASDIAAKPIIVANLATFDIPASQFVVGGTEPTVFGDVQNFDVFRDTFFRNNLIKTEFYFEINNTINRDYTINLELRDANDSPLYTISINVPAYKGTGVSTKVTKTETFENANLDLLKSTVKIAFDITRTSGSGSINSGSLKLSSSATVYLDIK